ncbi:hypothetical protein NC652_020256 [Populus alba x Populus x berolinensis]|nr:hypothetical protein NC652_020256 [Populus alba x Populus x berolinensis]
MLYHFVFNSLYVSKAVEVGNNFVVHQADQVMAEKAKTLQDRIAIDLAIHFQGIFHKVALFCVDLLRMFNGVGY